MSPPAIIGSIIWPLPWILEFKEAPVRTLRVHIRSLFIAFLILIYTFSVKPFVERTTVIEYSVKYNLHTTLVNLLHKPYEQLVTGLKIFLISYSVYISGRFLIGLAISLQALTLIMHDLSEMRVYIVIVLYIIFVITWRYKYRI